MEPKKKFWRKNGGGCSFLKLWTKSKLTKQPVVTTCPEYTSMERHTLRILRCMPDVTTIGVHGIGGIGKTSVLKAVIDFPPIKLLFDVVIWVSVSRNWSTRKIQDQVLRQLSLSTSQDSETNHEIAMRLFDALQSQRFLLLLDDVWEHISLDLIGIPQPAMENGCKMILSTRSRDVCRIMAADRMVQMERLLPEEAWELFQEQLGWIIDSGSKMWHYARTIVEKCHGLPLLIIVTGRALAKENDAFAWRLALKEFSHRNGIYKKLQFSFDRLESLELKSCFLYCAIFPEDRELRIIELVDLWIKEGLVAGNNLTDSRKKGCDIVDILVDASLLQILEGGVSIKMHDLIRDFVSIWLDRQVD
uniref:Uncharacterized protein n=1 Tax=Fagus sylvatica TaxID=28930 RepID=A0A2N9FWZ0_FAGSY